MLSLTMGWRRVNDQQSGGGWTMLRVVRKNWASRVNVFEGHESGMVGG